MSNHEARAEAHAAASKHGLDPVLVMAVCEQESAWNPWAVRYEPAFYERYIRPMVERAELKSPTEAYGRAHSWGIMQVMGQTAREHNFTERYFTEMCDVQVGLDIGCRVLKAKMVRAKGNVRTGLLYWNGGGRPDYATEVMDLMRKYAV